MMDGHRRSLGSKVAALAPLLCTLGLGCGEASSSRGAGPGPSTAAGGGAVGGDAGGVGGPAGTGGKGGAGSAAAGGKGGAAGSAATGGTGGSYASGSVEPGELDGALATALCEYYARCGLDSDYATHLDGGCASAVVAGLRNGVVAEALAALEKGTVSYDADAMAACLADLASTPCSAPLSPDLLCESAVTGLVPEGGDCTLSVECAGDERCDGATCPGQCVPRTEAGCVVDADCPSGGQCMAAEGGARFCRALARQGEPCAYSPWCIPGLFCTTESGRQAEGSCEERPRAATGEACGPMPYGTACAAGDVCAILGPGDPTGWLEQCVPVADSGGPCYPGPEDGCPPGEYCPITTGELFAGTYSASCAPTVALGEGCTVDVFGVGCGPLARCKDGICAALGELGATCTESGDCLSNSCVDGACAVLERCQ